MRQIFNSAHYRDRVKDAAIITKSLKYAAAKDKLAESSRSQTKSKNTNYDPLWESVKGVTNSKSALQKSQQFNKKSHKPSHEHTDDYYDYDKFDSKDYEFLDHGHRRVTPIAKTKAVASHMQGRSTEISWLQDIPSTSISRKLPEIFQAPGSFSKTLIYSGWHYGYGFVSYILANHPEIFYVYNPQIYTLLDVFFVNSWP